MAEDRPFAPTARRRNLARASGMTAASPLLVGAAACLAGVAFIASLGAAVARELGAGVRAAVSSAAAADATMAAPQLSPRSLSATLVGYAVPFAAALALAAALVHVVQTRAVWLPRRRLPGAPTADPMRGTHALLAVAQPAIVALVTLGWLYAMSPRLAALGVAPQAGALLVLSFAAALGTAWIAAGTLDALVRFAGYTAGLRMTREQQREDARLASADPRWAARRRDLARSTPLRDAVAGASVLILGDGAAAAVAWDPLHRPIPTRTAIGRDARATQLLALARRHAIPVHRDPVLARTLASDDGPVPDAHWPALATVIAAVRGRR